MNFLKAVALKKKDINTMQLHKETALFLKYHFKTHPTSNKKRNGKPIEQLMACLSGSVNTAFMLGRTDHTNA